MPWLVTSGFQVHIAYQLARLDRHDVPDHRSRGARCCPSTTKGRNLAFEKSIRDNIADAAYAGGSMTRQWFAMALLLLGACAVVQGCKTKTTPEVAAPPSVGLFLLDAGEEPRSQLRYEIEEGTTTKATTTVRVRTTGDEVSNRFLSGLRSLEFRIVYGPAELNGDRIKYPLQIVEARPIREPNASKAVKKKRKEQAALLRGAGAVIEIDDRGHLRSSQMNAVAADVPIRILWDLLTQLLTLSQVLLPDEPVGLGASWQYRGVIAIYGLKLEQVITYTLSERINDKPVLDVEFEELGEDQVVSVPGSEAPIEVKSVRMTSAGRAVLDLRSLVSSGSASGVARHELVVSEKGAAKEAITEDIFEIQVKAE